MDIELREVGEERHADFFRPIQTGFGTPTLAERNARFLRMPELVHKIGACDGEDIVGSAGTFAFEMSTPGATVKTAGLTVVAVLPTHRRRGILTQLMHRHFADARADGQPVSALWASEAGIYGRFGYGLASFYGSARIERDRSAFAAPLERTASARLLNEDEALARFPPIWERARGSVPGMLSRSQTWWSLRRVSDTEWTRKGRGDLQRVVLEIDGRDEAYAIYRLQFDWPEQVPSTQVEVIEAIGTTPASTALLWRYLLDLDTVKCVTTSFLPVDHPLLLLLEEPRRIDFRLGDALWLRILDVEAALAARRYGRQDRIVLEIEDRFCASNSGCYLLDGGARRAGRTREAPDMRLPIEALGSAYLGGFSFGRLAQACRGVVELKPGAIERADALFHAARAPWCPEIF